MLVQEHNPCQPRGLLARLGRRADNRPARSRRFPRNPIRMTTEWLTLSRRENQVRGLAQYALDFVWGRFGDPLPEVQAMLERFHVDSVGCAVSALAASARAPRLLRDEALEYAISAPRGATCFGSRTVVPPEKAVVANCSAVREWDANGTNFGYNPARGATRGEFGHNDFYPVALAAAQQAAADGRTTLRAMLCLDEIRGRLAEVFALRDHKIDHVLHGAIASALVYGAVLGASVDQLEAAVGLVVAHYVPFRAIRHGKQLSDSKGASAALSAEVAVLSARRAMRGFVGPADVFRNAEAIFCLFEPPAASGESPFDLSLAKMGPEFAICGMHFKLGLYEHQSAGAIEGLIQLLSANPRLLQSADELREVTITIYEPAYGIIGDPAKRDPRTRQSADHSMVYIVATLLRKAFELGRASWRELMLTPADYDDTALFHPQTRRLMQRIRFRHGGPEYDARYPDGIPTTVDMDHAQFGRCTSGLVMYPLGHARCSDAGLDELLDHKFALLVGQGVADVAELRGRLTGLARKTPREIAELYSFEMTS
jgi:2-methylcitrate dehydratase